MNTYYRIFATRNSTGQYIDVSTGYMGSLLSVSEKEKIEDRIAVVQSDFPFLSNFEYAKA